MISIAFKKLKGSDIFMKPRNLLIIACILLVSLFFTGCIDDSMLSEEHYESLEAKLDLLQERVEDFSRLMTEDERNQFEQQVELEIFRFSMALFDDLDSLTEENGEAEAAAVEALLDAYLSELEALIDELELAYAPAVSTVALSVGDSQAWVNQRAVTLDQPPLISETGRTLVPLRFIAEALSAEVQWDQADKKITYTKGSQEIVLHLNETAALVNGNLIDLEAPPVVINGRTLVPLRFISETMGFLVDWQGETQEVIIIGRLDGQLPAAFKPLEFAAEPAGDESSDLIAYTLLGVVVEATWDESVPSIGLLVNGELVRFEADLRLFENVIEEWDHYSHWGLYEAGLDESDRVVYLEYGEGVADITGIFADFYSEKTLADVLNVDGNIVMFTNVDGLLNSDDPDDLPGFSTMINDQLIPANGDIIRVSENAVAYVEGADGIFIKGSLDLINSSNYDYVEFYDIEGDLVYDIVIIWLI